MKNLFCLMLAWFCYQCSDPKDVAKFLSKVPKPQEAKIVVTSDSIGLAGRFYVFYEALEEIK